jgi:hypothetical protein
MGLKALKKRSQQLAACATIAAGTYRYLVGESASVGMKPKQRFIIGNILMVSVLIWYYLTGTPPLVVGISAIIFLPLFNGIVYFKHQRRLTLPPVE